MLVFFLCCDSSQKSTVDSLFIQDPRDARRRQCLYWETSNRKSSEEDKTKTPKNNLLLASSKAYATSSMPSSTAPIMLTLSWSNPCTISSMYNPHTTEEQSDWGLSFGNVLYCLYMQKFSRILPPIIRVSRWFGTGLWRGAACGEKGHYSLPFRDLRLEGRSDDGCALDAWAQRICSCLSFSMIFTILDMTSHGLVLCHATWKSRTPDSPF